MARCASTAAASAAVAESNVRKNESPSVPCSIPPACSTAARTIRRCSLSSSGTDLPARSKQRCRALDVGEHERPHGQSHVPNSRGHGTASRRSCQRERPSQVAQVRQCWMKSDQASQRRVHPPSVGRIGFAYGSCLQQRRHVVDRELPECRRTRERRRRARWWPAVPPIDGSDDRARRPGSAPTGRSAHHRHRTAAKRTRCPTNDSTAGRSHARLTATPSITARTRCRRS